MKPLISAVAIAGLFSLAACNSTAIQEKEAALQAQQRTIDALNLELAKKKAIDSINEVARMQYSTFPQNQMMMPQYGTGAVQYVPVREVHYVSSTRKSSAPRRSYSTRSNRSYSGYSQPVVYQQAPVQRKKGWSAKAKGAVIGGAGGAVAGAIINKRNRPVGALIGGILGAGAGTGIGAIIDRKNGR
jgi:hypothetical protein